MKKNWLYKKTVIISGASGGLGFQVAKLLIEKYDCKIIGIARNEKKILEAAETLKDKKENFSYKLFDVSVKENWENFKVYLEQNGIIPDVLINNAGFMLPFKRFDKLEENEIAEIIATNFVANVNSVKILMPLLKQSPSPAVINISSAAGLCAVIGESMYCATKFAMRGFTETLIQEYRKKIYVSGVYPGFIKTDILGRMSVSDKENRLIRKLMMPAGRAATKIVRGMSRHKKRIVMGIDGRTMSFFARLFPSFTPYIVAKVLKTSGLELFSEIFS